MWVEKCNLYIKEIESIEKFFVSYQSALLFFNRFALTYHLPPQIKESVTNASDIFIVLRDKPPDPNENKLIP